MANVEMRDYLSQVAADNNQTLDMKPNATIVETPQKYQEIHEGDDGSEEIIDFGTDDITIYHVNLQFKEKTESDIGTLMLFWNSSSYGHGRAKSFYWINYGEPSGSRHTYTVRFDCDVAREVRIGYRYHAFNVRLKVLGYK